MVRKRKGKRTGTSGGDGKAPEGKPSGPPSDAAERHQTDYKKLSYGGRRGCCYRLAQLVVCMVAFHYLFWWMFMVGFLYAIHLIGPLGDLLAVLLVMLYLPSYFNHDPFRWGRPWPWLRRMRLWRFVQNYLSVTAVRTTKLDPEKQYVFGIHPHGILVLSRVATYGNTFEELFPGLDFRVLGATPMFYVPGCREICLWMGAVDAGKNTARRILDEPDLSVMVYPGGSKEIFHTDPKSKDTVLVIKKRFGFVKLAIQKDAHLVPTFVFGEKWLYNRLRLPGWLRNFCLRRLRMPMILFWGAFFTCVPKSRPLGIVYGAPIDTPYEEDPSDETVQRVHAEYCKRVEALFHEHKASFGYGADEKLVMV